MTLREFVDRESRANPEMREVLEADAQQLEAYGAAAQPVIDQDAPPRWWQMLIMSMDRVRRASGHPGLGASE